MYLYKVISNCIVHMYVCNLIIYDVTELHLTLTHVHLHVLLLASL